MARPAYVDIATTATDTDSPADTDLWDALRDNTDAARIHLFWVHFAEQTTTSSTPTLKYTFKLYIPDLRDFSGVDRRITSDIEIKTDASGTAEVYLEDNVSGTAGATVLVNNTGYVDRTPNLAIDDVWVGTVRTIDVYLAAQDNTNAAYMRSLNSAAWRLEY